MLYPQEYSVDTHPKSRFTIQRITMHQTHNPRGFVAKHKPNRARQTQEAKLVGWEPRVLMAAPSEYQTDYLLAGDPHK